MGAIYVGAGATDRPSSVSSGKTYVDLRNACNASGTLTSIEIWAQSNLSGAKVAIFSRDGAKITPYDVVSIGSVTSGSKQTFTEDSESNPIRLEIDAGEYIGIYFSSGILEESTTGGSGLYSISGDQTEAGEKTYSVEDPSGAISLFATGETGFFAECSISVGASVAALGGNAQPAAVAMSTSASMTVAGIRQAVAHAAISAAASMSAEADTQHYVLLACSISTSASMTATNSQVWGGEVAIAVSPSMAAQAMAILGGIVSIDAISSVYAQCIGAQYCTVNIEAVPSVSALATADWNGAAAIAVVSSVSAAALAYVTKTMGFGGTLSASDVLIIDTDNRTVTLNGVNAREDFTGEFWELYDGTNEIAWHSSASPTAELKVEHEPRWL